MGKSTLLTLSKVNVPIKGLKLVVEKDGGKASKIEGLSLMLRYNISSSS